MPLKPVLQSSKVRGGLGGVAKHQKYGSAAAQVHGFKGGVVTYLRYGEGFYKKIRENWWNKLSAKEKFQRISKMNKGLDKYRKKQRLLARNSL